MKANSTLLLILGFIAVLTVSAGSCTSQGRDRVELKVLNAGSLMVPFLAMEQEFELKYPGIDVLPEGHGSVQVIRYITELGKEVDVAAVADVQLIPLLMYPVQVKGGQGTYADWYIKFASNRLGIAYRADSLYSTEITADNWYEIIGRPDVKFGLADPNIDSLGYRVLMTMQLAENYYQDEMIFEKLIKDNFTGEFEVVRKDGVDTIKIPELLKPIQKRIFLRSYSIQLLALLESGELDYAFEYESVARQRGLKFLDLPREIDLSSPDYAERYQQVSIKLGFQRFSSVTPEFEGMPIIYGITIPGNAPHRQEAILFLEFLLGTDGQRIFTENYQPPLVPVEADGINKVPDELRHFIK